MAFNMVLLVLLSAGQAVVAQQSPEEHITDLLRQAERAQQNNQPELFGAYSREILKRSLDKLGGILVGLHEYTLAERAFEQAIEFSDSPVDSLQGLSAVYLATRRLEEGLTVSRRILEIEADHTGARYLSAMLEFMLGRFEPAKGELERLYAAQPGNLSVAYSLALCLIKLGERARAFEILAALEEQSPPSSQLYTMLGRAYQEGNQLSDALRTLKLAIEMSPNTRGANYHLALTYLMNQELAAAPLAKLHLELELSRDPIQYFPNYLLGVVHIQERHPYKAIPYLEQAALADPENPDPYLHLGQSLLEEGRVEEAIAALQKSIELTQDPSRNDFQVARTHYSLAAALKSSGRSGEALLHLENAQKWMRQGHLRRMKDPAQAAGTGIDFRAANLTSNASLALMPQVERSEGGQPSAVRATAAFYRRAAAIAYTNLAGSAVQASRFAWAAGQLKKAAEWDDSLPHTHYNLALAYIRADRAGDALEPAVRALQEAPDEPETSQVMLHLARALAAAGKPQQAAEAHFQLASIQLDRDKIIQAIANLETASALAPSKAEIWHGLWRAYSGAGRDDEAAKAQQRYLQLKKDLAEEPSRPPEAESVETGQQPLTASLASPCLRSREGRLAFLMAPRQQYGSLL